MSQADTAARQRERLDELRLPTTLLPSQRDVDEPDDARAVAAAHPATRFAAVLAELDR